MPVLYRVAVSYRVPGSFRHDEFRVSADDAWDAEAAAVAQVVDNNPAAREFRCTATAPTHGPWNGPTLQA